MTTNTDDTRGGTQWELETAGKSMIAARHAGDVDGEVLALLRFSEGLRNSSLGVVGQVLAPLSAEVHEQKKALDTMVTTMQHISAVVVQIAETQKKSDARLGKLENEVADLVGRTTASEADRADIRGRLERVEAVDAELARLRDEVASVKAIIADRPAQREAEYRKIADRAADEAIKRLSEQKGGE